MNETNLFTDLHSSAEAVVVTTPDINNLTACVEDAKNAALDVYRGPDDPTDFNELRSRLESSRDKLPPLYQEAVFNPYVKTLDRLGPQGFNKILSSDPNRYGTAGLMLDIAHAILQNGESYSENATDAFQEVISDLYDGFLSAEDRVGVKPPDKSVIPPLVKWGNPSSGPYTWPIDATSIFGLKAAIVNLPPSNSKSGILAWAALGHETGGHDILHADTGLLAELQQAVLSELKEKNIGYGLPEYWADRIDETASDVLGILNMGPAAGIGLIGYFRGLNFAFGGKPVLRNIGYEYDSHPADILRGYLAASSVGMLNFAGAKTWARIIEDETDKDLSGIQISDTYVDVSAAKDSAKLVARAIIHTKLKSLENHKLSQIQNWRNRDESIVKQLGETLTTTAPLPTSYSNKIYATHVVAAAVMKAVAGESDIPLIFERMKAILKTMHDNNPSWGPLYVKYPGDIAPHIVYRNSTYIGMHY
ncbi:MAG: hypothetical protein N3B21_13475 [Clostridia bacterium]|nr:hypothetical protein [Clostridia bacterium]